MEPAEYQVVISHGIHGASCKFIPEQGRIAFDKCVETFLIDEIGGDGFDLMRRTSVQRGYRRVVHNVRADRIEICLCKVLELAEIIAQN